MLAILAAPSGLCGSAWPGSAPPAGAAVAHSFFVTSLSCQKMPWMVGRRLVKYVVRSQQLIESMISAHLLKFSFKSPASVSRKLFSILCEARQTRCDEPKTNKTDAFLLISKKYLAIVCQFPGKFPASIPRKLLEAGVLAVLAAPSDLCGCSWPGSALSGGAAAPRSIQNRCVFGHFVEGFSPKSMRCAIF